MSLYFFNVSAYELLLQCPPLNRITFVKHKSESNNRMIQLFDVFCVLLRYKRQAISDYIKSLIQLSVIQVSGGHFICKAFFCSLFIVLSFQLLYSYVKSAKVAKQVEFFMGHCKPKCSMWWM
jgi:hypothetical protein